MFFTKTEAMNARSTKKRIEKENTPDECKKKRFK
jgi:hypothetical protein